MSNDSEEVSGVTCRGKARMTLNSLLICAKITEEDVAFENLDMVTK